MDLSIVIPLLNERESLGELVEWISRVCEKEKYEYEILLIDDGSTDGSWEEILKLSEKYPSLKGLRFRRNYGKSAALHCGFARVKGDVVMTMDADLQDSPDEIPEMVQMIKSGKWDIVSGWKKHRHDSKLTKNLPSKLYNGTARLFTGIKLHDMNCGIKAYRREVVENIEVYGEMHRYIPVMAAKAGFNRITEKVVVHQARKHGKSKFGISRFIYGFLDLMSILFITRFGKKPMHLFGSIGTLLFLVGFIAAAYLGIEKLIAVANDISAPLITTSPYFYLALTTMILGSQFFLAGFLGELVARTSSDRNNYQIAEEVKL